MATYPLRLSGWEEQSIIGSDDQLGGWFAQLWRNGTTSSDSPEATVTAPSPAGLADPIAAATHVPAGEVEDAVQEAWEGSHRTEWWQRR